MSASKTLTDAAEMVLSRAVRSGATDAEVVAYESDGFSVRVRLGEVETLEQSGSRALGLRVFRGLRSASTSTSDLSADGLAHLVEGALALAGIAGEDPYAGLAEREEFGQLAGELPLFFADVEQQQPEARIDIARRCEAAAMAVDARITNSGGSDFDTSTSTKLMVNSRGFSGTYRRSTCGFSAVPIATDADGRMQRAGWSSSARSVGGLESPESIGRIAGERTVRMLGARPVSTQRVPVVFAPEIARSLIGALFEAANGDAMYRHATFLDGMLGERVAGENVTLVDDGTMVMAALDGAMVGGFGTRPFDAEGLPTRRTVVVERGILRSFVLNSYTARKLGMLSTGSASRGLAGAPGVGAGNLFLEPGTLTPEALLADIPQGLYVTSTMGFGVNGVTGDYSQGASGLWIEGGALAYPVEEITIAGNLKEMFRNISAHANDLHFRSSVACPTLRVEGMTVGGS